jgi:hypothetical protein
VNWVLHYSSGGKGLKENSSQVGDTKHTCTRFRCPGFNGNGAKLLDYGKGDSQPTDLVFF